jgi:hypothetical protein
MPRYKFTYLNEDFNSTKDFTASGKDIGAAHLSVELSRAYGDFCRDSMHVHVTDIVDEETGKSVVGYLEPRQPDDDSPIGVAAAKVRKDWLLQNGFECEPDVYDFHTVSTVHAAWVLAKGTLSVFQQSEQMEMEALELEHPYGSGSNRPGQFEDDLFI